VDEAEVLEALHQCRTTLTVRRATGEPVAGTRAYIDALLDELLTLRSPVPC
jgi:hypothetical protein